MAGFETIFASEFVKEARDCYALNFPGIPIDPRDVRAIKESDVEWLRGKADVLIGSPPCASFSMAARGEKGLEGGWGKEKEYGRSKKQRTDDLFLEYTRLLKAIQPKAFVAENVQGLVRGKATGWFLEFLRGFREAGYRAIASLLDAQWLGVPQVRQRLFFVGFREDLDLVPTFPEPLPYRYTVFDAVSALDDYPNIVEDDAGIEGYAIEAEAKKLEPGQKSSKFFNLRRLDWDAPARTILASSGHPGAAGPLHPAGTRKLSIAELKAICGFPQDFVLSGTYEQQWERLGRAVPPPMAEAVARILAKQLAASGA
jgi:DNA (cytosine-5)-methyltransferase 1